MTAAPKGNAGHDLDAELMELLNELRVALPGVQVLFAFLLVVPFNQRWEEVDAFEKSAYFTSFLATVAATILFIAPTAHHRLRWRVRDKEALLSTSNRLAIAGTFFLAVAVTAAVSFVTHFLFDGGPAWWLTAVTGLLFALVWYGMPFYRSVKSR